VKSLMIVAALGAALTMSAPVTAQAAMAKLTDHDLYCSFMPLTSKCAPAKPMAKPAMKVAMSKPGTMAKHVPFTGMEMMVCTKRTDGKPYLMSCIVK